MDTIDKINKTVEEDWARHVIRKSERNPPKKQVSLGKVIGKSWRQKIKLGKETYYLSGFDRNEPGELRIGLVKLPAAMDAATRVEALLEFANNLVDLPTDVICVAVWKDAQPPAAVVS